MPRRVRLGAGRGRNGVRGTGSDPVPIPVANRHGCSNPPARPTYFAMVTSAAGEVDSRVPSKVTAANQSLKPMSTAGI